MTRDVPEVWWSGDLTDQLRLQDLPLVYLEHLEPYTVLNYAELTGMTKRVRITNEVLAEVRAERNAEVAALGLSTSAGQPDRADGTGPAFRSMLGDTRRNLDEAARYGVVSWRDLLLEKTALALTKHEPKDLAECLVAVAALAVEWREALHRRGVAPVERPAMVMHATQVADIAELFWGPKNP
ncbi:hypothetical protein [Lentzea sp. NEAU-D7]|uniref:hypothetical protein n=1 Tax=Lentzea sp. NEAU-D7 TaxID=2994667 RepID=UPI00224AD28A|nr:hypothetical protein [Lentzea sp. NEAU-D7]MCX2949962.1 hypothetical protein [Lentzea sp. NEAU-D7]